MLQVCLKNFAMYVVSISLTKAKKPKSRALEVKIIVIERIHIWIDGNRVSDMRLLGGPRGESFRCGADHDSGMSDSRE